MKRHRLTCKKRDIKVKKGKQSTKTNKSLQLTAAHKQGNKYVCEYCDSSYTRRSSLTSHLKKCSKRYVDEKLKEVNQEHKFQDIKKELEHEKELRKLDKKRLRALEKDTKYLKKMLDIAGNIVQKSMSAFSRISKKYPDAPVMEELTLEDFKRGRRMLLNDVEIIEIKNIIGEDDDNEKSLSESESDDESDDVSEDVSEESVVEIEEDGLTQNSRLAEDLLYHCEHGNIIKYIGDTIIVLCKKNKDKDQSIWNSDPSRLTYIIKQILEGEARWMVDKEGVNTTKLIVTPILDQLQKIIEEYYNDKCVNLGEKDYKVRLKIHKTYLELCNKIDNNTLHKGILKYIAPYFYHDKNEKDKKVIKKK